MFMWFSDGAKIPPGISPLPQNTRIDYIKRLKEECAKLFITKTPVYLVYMGRLLNKEQIKLLEELQDEIPNLAVINYDEVERTITNQKINSKVATTAAAYIENEKLHVGIGGIADLVDFTRLILLYNSKTLRDIARKKITIPLEWHEGLIYRDFDVTLEKESMPDIPTTHGYMATLNFQERVNGYRQHLIESAQYNQNLIQRINSFFNKYIYNLEQYQKILKLFLNKSLNAEEEKAKQSFILEYNEIFHEKNFKSLFIHHIRIENSFIAINKDQHPIINNMIKQVLNGESPYAVVQLHFGRHLNFLNRFKEYLTPQQLGFNIGNDLTWKMSVREQHTLDCLTTTTAVELQKQTNDTTPPSPDISATQKNLQKAPLIGGSENTSKLQDQVIVNQLSKLSKDYLDHLKKSSKKSNFLDKYNLMLELNAILDDPSNDPSKKLSEFASRLQKVDKEVLKNHREPNWAKFKKLALFLLGITVIGAVVGLIDYSFRRHHSIFYQAKSHGERFVLDVEEHISKVRAN